MISYEDIGKVLRRLDEEAKNVPFEQILRNFGIDEEGGMRAAQQRGLRAYLLGHGRELPRANEPVMVPDVNQDELALLSATWMDGFITGMKLLMNMSLPDDSHRRSGI